MQTHISKTRKIQRLVTKHLKSLGLKATSKAAKSSQGWLTNVNDMIVSKRRTNICKSLGGRSIKVIYK